MMCPAQYCLKSCSVRRVGGGKLVGGHSLVLFHQVGWNIVGTSGSIAESCTTCCPSTQHKPSYYFIRKISLLDMHLR
jgi:hypothetical protein